MSLQRGVFLAIEGGEGAGKGSVLLNLVARLRAANMDVMATREPGGTPEGLELRALLLASQGAAWDPWAELLLMTAARIQHVRKIIEPAVQAGRIVISDRFAGSTIAYQGAGRGMPVAEIERLHQIAVGNLWPDLTIVLDIDPRIGIERSLRRLQEQALDEGRFEHMDLSFHQRVRDSFLQQALSRPESHIVVDASAPLEGVCDAVYTAVSDWLKRNNSA